MKAKRILALCLCAGLVLGLVPAYAKDEGVIEIASAKELLDLSRRCTLDTWSQGKTVALTADIDLLHSDFEPIPTFGGVFDGGGHTVSGLTVERDGSYQGLFRYVQEGAVVRDLKVKGDLSPGGSASAVGGIAGRNYGTLQNCSFEGTVSGKNNVGGIVGINEGTGELTACAAAGMITGEHYTGGIAGQNLGALVSCANRAQINTHEEEVTVSLDELNWEKVNSTENMRAHTDSGGITGFSSGIVQSCTNYGTIGYPHTGYNVGGIVGRQSGFLDGCVNEGTVYGRKDVGGIVGQLEPYLLMQFSEDSMQKLDAELDTLSNLLRQLGNQTADTGDLINVRADALNGHLEQVRTGAHDVAGWTTDFLDGTVDTVNDLSARVSRTFDRLTPIFDDLGDTGGGLGDAFRKIGDSIDQVDDASVWGEAAAEDARRAFDRMGDAADAAWDAVHEVADALAALRSSQADRDAMQAALTQLQTALSNLKAALDQLGTLPDEIAELLRQLAASGSIDPTGAIGQLAALGEAFRQAAQAVSEVLNGVSGLINGTENGASLGDRITQGMNHLREGLHLGDLAMRALRRASGNLNDAFDNLGVMRDELDGTLAKVSDAFGDMESAMDSMEDAADGMRNLSDELANEPKLELPALNSDYNTRVDSIFDGLQAISDETSGLRSDLSSSGDRIKGTADAINDQINVISDLMIDGYTDLIDRDEEPSDKIEDISDSDDTGRQGRVAQSVNMGAVEGDVDVGGIAGAMAVEYDLDPEDDINRTGQRSANFIYQTRAVVTACRNEGGITAKKNCAGGIVGRMDLGRVSACEGYGTVTSTDGAYVGGIAGASYAALRDCWAKCALSGGKYVGGIAGLAHDVSGCRAVVELESEGECVGAVAGDADGNLLQNFYVDDTRGAVDGVSYAGQAEPVSYEALAEMEGLPGAFRTFTVTFMVDGALYREETAGYDESLAEVPAPPAREGQFGEWSDEDFTHLRANKTVEARYSPFITVLESDEDAEGRALLLAEGQFDRHASLVMQAAEHAPANAACAWKVRISRETGGGGYTFRALAVAGEDEKELNTVWLAAEDGRWTKAKSERDGSYLVFPVEGDEVTFALGYEANGQLTVSLAAGIALLVAAAILRRRRRKRKAQKPKLPKRKKAEKEKKQ